MNGAFLDFERYFFPPPLSVETRSVDFFEHFESMPRVSLLPSDSRNNKSEVSPDPGGPLCARAGMKVPSSPDIPLAQLMFLVVRNEVLPGPDALLCMGPASWLDSADWQEPRTACLLQDESLEDEPNLLQKILVYVRLKRPTPALS